MRLTDTVGSLAKAVLTAVTCWCLLRCLVEWVAVGVLAGLIYTTCFDDCFV